MNVTLINPNLNMNMKIGDKQPPLGLAYIAAVLELKGHNVKIIDAEFENLSSNQIVQRLNPNTDVVGITGTTMVAHELLKIASSIRQKYPSIFLVVGGPFFNALPKETMKTGVFNAGILGEAEFIFPELVNAFEKGIELKKVDSIVYITKGKLKFTGIPAVIKNIDTLPFPARHLLPNLKFYKPKALYKSLPSTTIISSRGCPNKCIFCDNSISRKKVRMHSPERVVKEIELLINKYGIKELDFVDDNLTLSPERILRICRLIRDKNISISWRCLARVDTISKVLLKEMKKSGCWLIAYGIESGNQNVLDYIQKGINLNQIKKAVKLTNEAGIASFAYFMLGFPIDTKQTIDDTIKFALSLNLDYITFNKTVIYPGTKLYNTLLESGSFGKINWFENPPKYIYYHPNISSRELEFKRRRAYLHFYLHPSYIFKKLFRVNSFTQLIKLNIQLIRHLYN